MKAIVQCAASDESTLAPNPTDLDFEHAATALRQLERGHARGKTVLTI